jgi:Membrane bound FAD containing D-sorbitol dehydrogenase
MKLLTRPIARRALLVLPGSLFALFLLPRRRAEVAPAAIGLPEFLTLSTRLTGKTDLDPEAANIYLTAFAASPRQRARLADLTQGRQSHPDLEREIILAWYTGLCKSGSESRMATYRGAMTWKALGIPAPGTCGGTTGFWAQPGTEAR